MNFDQTITVAAGAGTTVIKPRNGKLRTVLVTAAGTGSGSVLFYDNATTGSGTVIGVVPATVSVGATYSFNLPAGAGITCVNVVNGPAMTVSYD